MPRLPNHQLHNTLGLTLKFDVPLVQHLCTSVHPLGPLLEMVRVKLLGQDAVHVPGLHTVHGQDGIGQGLLLITPRSKS